jgi:hypothetical protein
MGILKTLFSVRNNKNNSHKIITILGVKITIKKRINLNAPINNFGILNNNKEVVILGNGPSLKDTFNDINDYNFIKNKDIFVVNSFMKDDKFYELKPKYLCLMDPIYWDTNLSKEVQTLLNNDKKELEKVCWNLIIFMPKAAKNNNVFKDLSKTNSYIKFCYINTDTSNTSNKTYLYSMYKQNITMPAVQNVLIGCLYIAINLGYKNIFLYGADHSWHLSLIVNDNNIPCIIDKHFFDREEISQYTPVYKDASWNTPFRISELFKAYMVVHEQYEILEDYSKYMGANIYNLSKFSCIDAFQRKIKNGEMNNVKK